MFRNICEIILYTIKNRKKNVGSFFIEKYLHVIQNKTDVIKKVADFLEEELSTEAIENILQCTTFSGMKENADIHLKHIKAFFNRDASVAFRKGLSPC